MQGIACATSAWILLCVLGSRRTNCLLMTAFFQRCGSISSIQYDIGYNMISKAWSATTLRIYQFQHVMYLQKFTATEMCLLERTKVEQRSECLHRFANVHKYIGKCAGVQCSDQSVIISRCMARSPEICWYSLHPKKNRPMHPLKQHRCPTRTLNQWNNCESKWNTTWKILFPNVFQGRTSQGLLHMLSELFHRFRERVEQRCCFSGYIS